MTKPTRKQPKTPELDDETTSTMVMGTLGVGLGKLNTHIEALPPALNDESALALAHLLTKIATVAGELRKAEHAARRAAGEVTPQQCAEIVRRMSPSDRAQFLRTAAQIDQDAGRSGLA